MLLYFFIFLTLKIFRICWWERYTHERRGLRKTKKDIDTLWRKKGDKSEKKEKEMRGVVYDSINQCASAAFRSRVHHTGQPSTGCFFYIFLLLSSPRTYIPRIFHFFFFFHFTIVFSLSFSFCSFFSPSCFTFFFFTSRICSQTKIAMSRRHFKFISPTYSHYNVYIYTWKYCHKNISRI